MCCMRSNTICSSGFSILQLETFFYFYPFENLPYTSKLPRKLSSPTQFHVSTCGVVWSFMWRWILKVLHFVLGDFIDCQSIQCIWWTGDGYFCFEERKWFSEMWPKQIVHDGTVVFGWMSTTKWSPGTVVMTIICIWYSSASAWRVRWSPHASFAMSFRYLSQSPGTNSWHHSIEPTCHDSPSIQGAYLTQ